MQKLVSLALHRTRISAKTVWTFVELCDADGRVGWGEATLTGRESLLRAQCDAFASDVLHNQPLHAQDFAKRHWPCDLVESALVSAIDHALWDLQAQQSHQTLAQALGGAARSDVPMYANFNRRTLDRSPAGFAASAATALAQGHTAFKLAPFDHAHVGQSESDALQAMQRGLDCVAAVRNVVGPTAPLMVDCHWRFSEATATQLVREAIGLGLHWVECPLPETPENIPALCRLRAQANQGGVRLAGLEEGIRAAAFAPFIEAGAYDVVMPDVKYFGGLTALMQAAADWDKRGVAVSPHNPSGPVCHAVSLHLAAALPRLHSLEMQFDESPLFEGLIDGVLAPIHDGLTQPPSASPTGLGLALNKALLKQHAQADSVQWLAP